MSIPEKYLDMLSTLPKRSGCHDIGHTCRVLMLAFRLAEAEKLTEQEKDLLMQAVVYHDAGRTDDTANVQHGLAGYLVYCSAHGTNDVVEFLTRYHSHPDHIGLAALDSRDWGMDKDRLLLLFNIIKDADALDRVRFGPYGVDRRYLRLQTSHHLIEYAQVLLEAWYEQQL